MTTLSRNRAYLMGSSLESPVGRALPVACPNRVDGGLRRRATAACELGRRSTAPVRAFAIAEQKQGESPIMLVDEIERGLEPYRQRGLMERLQHGKSQILHHDTQPRRHLRFVEGRRSGTWITPGRNRPA